MTSLASRAEALLNRLAQLQSQRVDQDARSAVARARSRANRCRQKLDGVSRSIPILNYHDVRTPAISESIRSNALKARRILRTTATAVVGAETSDIASRVSKASVDDALQISEKLAESLMVDLNKAVESRRSLLLPPDIDQPIITYPGTSDSLAVKLKNIQRRLQMKVERLDSGTLEQRLKEIVDDVENWVRDRRLLDNGLEMEHPEIQEFLRRAATDDGAPWHLITPKVEEWLADSENAAPLRVVLRS